METTSYLIAAMLLLAGGQVLQKLAAARHLVAVRSVRDLSRALLTKEMIGAVLCLVLGMLAWLLVLYRTDVSRAFPILSMGSILVLGASRLYLGESVSPHRWAGAILIAFGVALVSAS